MEHPGQLEVVGEPAPPADQATVLLAEHPTVAAGTAAVVALERGVGHDASSGISAAGPSEIPAGCSAAHLTERTMVA